MKKPTRRNVGKFVVLGFGGNTNDRVVDSAMNSGGLRPVTDKEFIDFCGLIKWKPVKPIAAFGNIANGPVENGGFPGVPYIDTGGGIKVEENWTRGSTGDLWGSEWEFVFVPVS